MNQKEQVIEAMKNNGGYATLQQLNVLVDVSKWKSKTPYASIRRIVQVNNEFFKIKPGLWALREYEKCVFDKFEIKKGDKKSEDYFTHGYYQGILIEMGNMHHYETYVPAQDKNRRFLETPLKEIATVPELPNFSYDYILRKAKTVDVIWFNERMLPYRFYEVEHSTDIKNSLNKFFELQDFRTDYYIIADDSRKKQFYDIMECSIYSPIRDYVKFFSYENLVKQYESERSLVETI